MFRIIALLLCASTRADYVVDWRVPQANDANANAWVADGGVEVTDAASPKSVITQSRRAGPMFSGISCRPCK